MRPPWFRAPAWLGLGLAVGVLGGCRNYKLTEGAPCDADAQCIDQRCIGGFCGGVEPGGGGGSGDGGVTASGDGGGSGGIGDLPGGDDGGDEGEGSLLVIDDGLGGAEALDEAAILAAFDGAPATVVWADALPEALEPFDGLLFANPLANPGAEALARVATFVGDGGRLAVLGEPCVPLGACASDIEVLNAILVGAGSVAMEFSGVGGREGEVELDIAFVVSVDPLMAGVDLLRADDTARLVLDTSMPQAVRTAVSVRPDPSVNDIVPLVAVERVGAGEVVALADSSLFAPTALEDAALDNARLLRNLASVPAGE